ncbi:hypothetical protein JTE90_000750 [Oedothorax gibbosus]|uniref:Uncharacterized protein n=1 Tax=Oedothorax gibbosus TaxID=931172 RepID=A0AAV6UPX7_9ARAC|nr:hypothetical protein JTE90_000750 [Oedothorax gibbosus]
MIDWVSIVRTSRRRFSSYKYIPGRIRKRKKKQQAAAAAAEAAAKVESPPKPPPSQGCPCCYLSRKYRYDEDEPLKDFSGLDGLPRSLLESRISDNAPPSLPDSPRRNTDAWLLPDYDQAQTPLLGSERYVSRIY